mmetsp:Transcript_22882/g.71219  ORF Transcript_22882/g.71219 Transcript_22882/m.71219 type:complete len:265 (-) Transcript_22882:315-1109(-)
MALQLQSSSALHVKAAEHGSAQPGGSGDALPAKTPSGKRRWWLLRSVSIARICHSCVACSAASSAGNGYDICCDVAAETTGPSAMGTSAAGCTCDGIGAARRFRGFATEPQRSCFTAAQQSSGGSRGPRNSSQPPSPRRRGASALHCGSFSLSPWRPRAQLPPLVLVPTLAARCPAPTTSPRPRLRPRLALALTGRPAPRVPSRPRRMLCSSKRNCSAGKLHVSCQSATLPRRRRAAATPVPARGRGPQAVALGSCGLQGPLLQ